MKTKHLIYLLALTCGLLLKSTGASAAQTWINCTQMSVATYSKRIHIRCANSSDGIFYFAYGTKKDPAGAARYMSIATSALIAGSNNVRILYDPEDLSGASIGCQTSDCRLILGLEVFRMLTEI